MAIEFEIADYTPESDATTNLFIEPIRALADAGEGKQLTFAVPADDLNKTLKAVRAAANHLELTARKRAEIANDDGTVTLTFTVGARQYRPNAGRTAKPKAK